MNLNLLEDLKSSSPYIIKHSEAVLAKALKIANNFDVDLKHSMPGHSFMMWGELNPGSPCNRGAKILRENNFKPEVVRIAEVHIGAGIPERSK